MITPIVLHHGILAVGDIRIGPVKIPYFGGIERMMSERGYPVIVAGVHRTAGVATRAVQLKDTILRQLGGIDTAGGKLIIIAHSMGGLDARFMISRLGMADRVAALVTIVTPHRGSPYADWVVRNIGHRLRALQLVRKIGVDAQGAMDLTLEACARFNEKTPDAPGVRYFSVSAVCPADRMPALGKASQKIVYAAEGDNDGLVSITSATWGEHLWTWLANHWETIDRARLGQSGSRGQIIPHYRQLIDLLETRGIARCPRLTQSPAVPAKSISAAPSSRRR
jgi:triacylglycerol lipase